MIKSELLAHQSPQISIISVCGESEHFWFCDKTCPTLLLIEVTCFAAEHAKLFPLLLCFAVEFGGIFTVPQDLTHSILLIEFAY